MQPVTGIQRTLLMKDFNARVCKGFRGTCMQPVTSIQRTFIMKDLDARVCKGLRGMHAASHWYTEDFINEGL